MLNPNPLSIIRDSLLKNRIALHASTIEYKQWTDFVDYNKELVFMKKAFLKMEQFVKGILRLTIYINFQFLSFPHTPTSSCL